MQRRLRVASQDLEDECGRQEPDSPGTRFAYDASCAQHHKRQESPRKPDWPEDGKCQRSVECEGDRAEERRHFAAAEVAGEEEGAERG